MSTACTTEKHVFPTIKEVANFSSELITKTATEAISQRGVFTLGVSGGSIIGILADKLLDNPLVEWGKWKVFFCDERLTEFSNSDSTYGQFREKLIDKANCHDSWFPIDPNLPVAECAVDYESKLRSVFSGELPKFDLLLLGMGPDGHTCSLFPGHKLLNETKSWIAPIDDSPKPPPCRVTMTFPVLNNACNVAFISTGGSKADTIKKIFASHSDGKPLLPAARVQPKNGVLHWIMDQSAASKL
nr:6-phosphogluconolactonase-like [Ciona intestinalis]|eukprot:XP_026696680.1 6-phosphogluconolactonase-like [Ciona intestinalis]